LNESNTFECDAILVTVWGTILCFVSEEGCRVGDDVNDIGHFGCIYSHDGRPLHRIYCESDGGDLDDTLMANIKPL